ncbi:FMN-dependent NADH-azoreductase [Massilia arenae]|uniref:FMN dependent NADH:quinone oxidoreductase n=1 Tax=Massilia arenae TaxID=2603288 RepID=A0A5C7G6W1_9BURK|nr:NAD(P)H-dependent oxidoreductase [Massilia arenae]TXG01693.1 flavodoxin family protein [Massilia arenae]
MNILHISASPRGPQAASRELSNHVVERLLARHPGATVTVRELAGVDDEPALPHIDAGYALALSSAANEPGVDGAQLRSDGLIEELVRADIVVIGTPMHNLTVPSTLKSWIDHVVRINRTMRPTPEGKVGNLHDRPVYLALASGGIRTGERARQPDFLEPYLRAILAMIGLKDVTVFSAEGLALGAERAAEGRARAWAEMERHFGS